jgi:hypothetical protein
MAIKLKLFKKVLINYCNNIYIIINIYYEIANCILKQLCAEPNVVFFSPIVKPRRRKQKKFKSNLTNLNFSMIIVIKE